MLSGGAGALLRVLVVDHPALVADALVVLPGGILAADTGAVLAVPLLASGTGTPLAVPMLSGGAGALLRVLVVDHSVLVTDALLVGPVGAMTAGGLALPDVVPPDEAVGALAFAPLRVVDHAGLRADAALGHGGPGSLLGAAATADEVDGVIQAAGLDAIVVGIGLGQGNG